MMMWARQLQPLRLSFMRKKKAADRALIPIGSQVSNSHCCVNLLTRGCRSSYWGTATEEETRAKEQEVYLMILISSLMLTWSGTRNLVLSRIGSCFSPL